MRSKRPLTKFLGLIPGYIILLIACGAPQPAAIPTLTPPPNTAAPSADTAAPLNPSARSYISLAYDVESGRVILFGGQTGDYAEAASYNGETWSYDFTANRWLLMQPAAAPTARAASELAYDSESDRVILFGGCVGPSFERWGSGATWAYDYNTNTWMEMAKGPNRHVGPRLAYDSESDRVILFGGYDMNDFFYNDTWAYDFNTDTWKEMKPKDSPPGRNYQAMTYDSKADRVLVWGGLNISGSAPVDESIWAYDYNSNSWQEIKPVEPYPKGREYPAMVYDPAADRTILFGGNIGGDETWSYDYNLNTWTKQEPVTTPEKTSRHAMAYAADANRIILFGGQAGAGMFFTNETWAYDFDKVLWTNVTQQP